ncbi:MAG: peptide chain release factor 1 [Acidimicrobiia bacterium]|nr:peptide chain release factor 1 [Acidimicrobiia bacterium]
MDEGLARRLEEIEAAFMEVEAALGDPAVLSDPSQVAEYGKRHADLKDVVADFRRWKSAGDDLIAARQMSSDPEMAQMAKDLSREIDQLAARIRLALIPTDPNDTKDVLVEVRAGVGGDEASLWAGDMVRMYEKYAERHRLKVETLESSPSESGGYDKITVSVKGRGAYSRFKYEAGVHRVQRVPKTESQGRIHTSTATVAVLPEVDDVEVQLDLNDVKVDVYRSTGPGGQSVNTTDSAVRLTHEPTGLVVTCQDEKSQLQNKEKAFRILRARLYQMELERQQEELAGARRDQVGTGGRSEKIRTYNFKENRVTDHRISLTIRRLDSVLQGDLDEFVEALVAEEQARALTDPDD